MFNQQEVQILLGGVNSPVDLDDLRKNTNYGGLYDDNESTITAFWNVSELTFSPPCVHSDLLLPVYPTLPIWIGCQLLRPGAVQSPLALCHEL
jgi:hypothetical protein